MTLEDSTHIGETDDLKHDSGESFSSLFRPVEGIRESAKERAFALINLGSSLGTAFSLPVAPLLDAVESQLIQSELAVDRIKNSDHESAHFLLTLLNQDPMNDVWVTPYGNQVSIALGFPSGSVSPIYRGVASLLRSAIRLDFEDLKNPMVLDASKLSDQQIVQHSFMLLAGDAVNADVEDGKMKKSLGKRFVLPAIGGSDVALVKKLLKTTKYKDVAKKVFDLLIDRIMDFLSDPGVRRIVDIFSVKLLESGHIHMKGESIVPMMMKLLEENGVSKADFEGFQKKYDEMVKATVEELRGLVE